MAINLKGFINSILGKPIEKMSDKEFAEAIDNYKANRPEKEWKHSFRDINDPNITLEALQDDFDVYSVRFMCDDKRPCSGCSALHNAVMDMFEAQDLEQRREKFHEHKCAAHYVPMKLNLEATSPDRKKLIRFDKVNEAVEQFPLHPHYNDEDDEWKPFESFIINEADYKAGKYSELDGSELFFCVRKTIAELQMKAPWLIDALDASIQLGMSNYVLPMAYRLRGELHLSLDNKIAALQDFHAALEINPKVGVKKVAAKLEKEIASEQGATSQ